MNKIMEVDSHIQEHDIYVDFQKDLHLNSGIISYTCLKYSLLYHIGFSIRDIFPKIL